MIYIGPIYIISNNNLLLMIIIFKILYLHPYENLLDASSTGIEPGINWYNPSATISRYFLVIDRGGHDFSKINNTMLIYQVENIITC